MLRNKEAKYEVKIVAEFLAPNRNPVFNTAPARRRA
jgi:hypothetical protein